MNVHITKTYNIGGLTGLRQNAVRNAGEALGCKEMSLFKFPDRYDTDTDLHVRMDGIISALCLGDIVIFQHPSGESPRYDGVLFEHIKRYQGTRIAAFVQDIASQCENNEYSLEEELVLLDKADMHIFASEDIRKYYIDNGLEEKPYIIQLVPDYMTDVAPDGQKQNKLYLLTDRYDGACVDIPSGVEIISYDEYYVTETLIRISEGGMGLIWNADNQALSLYMAAGVPVIVRAGLPCAAYVSAHGLGAVAENLNDIYGIIRDQNADISGRCHENVKKIRNLFTNGIYTKKLLMDTIIMISDNF